MMRAVTSRSSSPYLRATRQQWPPTTWRWNIKIFWDFHINSEDFVIIHQDGSFYRTIFVLKIPEAVFYDHKPKLKLFIFAFFATAIQASIVNISKLSTVNSLSIWAFLRSLGSYVRFIHVKWFIFVPVLLFYGFSYIISTFSQHDMNNKRFTVVTLAAMDVSQAPVVFDDLMTQRRCFKTNHTFLARLKASSYAE